MKKLIAAGAVLALIIPSVAAAKSSLNVSPNPAKAGSIVKVSGSFGKACKKGGKVTLQSAAFKGATLNKVGTLVTKALKGGKFSKTTTIPTTVTAGRYSVTAACNPSGIALAFLKVT